MRNLSLAWIFVLVLVIAAASVFAGLAHDRAFGLLREGIGLGPAIGAYLAAITALALLSLAATWLSRIHPSRETSPGASGLLLVLSALVTIYVATNAVSYAVASRDIYAIELAATEFEGTEMVPVAPDGLSIVGTIGRTFMSDFLAAEKKYGAFSWIELRSPGGLVSEALALARLVEARRIKVIVRKHCSSACVLIAVASPESYAEESAVFGFHRSSPVTEIRSEIAIHGFQETDKLADQFLRDHGVPESIMTQAAEHGEDSLLIVNASDMVSVGAIHGVFKGKAVVQTGPKTLGQSAEDPWWSRGGSNP